VNIPLVSRLSQGPVADATRTVTKRLTELGQGAIEPLPLPDPVPLRLRRLEWTHKPGEEAGVVRDLFGRVLDPEHENELGCAYALLAFEQRSDEYWLRALEHLHRAQAGGFAPAGDNLSNVAKESGFSPSGSSPSG
jgi:hypothetical protein